MRKTFFTLAAVCGLSFASLAHAAPMPASAAAPAISASQATPVATVIVRHGRPYARPFRRPVCVVNVTRVRTGHGWVTRRVRRCR